jgi:hypothetical protein
LGSSLSVLGLESGVSLRCQLGFVSLTKYVEAASHAHPTRLFYISGPRPATLPEGLILALRLAGAKQVGDFRPQYGRIAYGQKAAESAIQEIAHLRGYRPLVFAKPVGGALIGVGAREFARRGGQQGWPNVWPAMPLSESTLLPNGNWVAGRVAPPAARAFSVVAGLGEEQPLSRTPLRIRTVMGARGKRKEYDIIYKN